MLTDFQNSLTDRLSGKFAPNSYLNIPPHLRCVAHVFSNTVQDQEQTQLAYISAPIKWDEAPADAHVEDLFAPFVVDKRQTEALQTD